MGIASMTLGITGLVSWIFPPLGFPISTAGLILGILARVVSKQQRGRAGAGIVMCILGIAINIGVAFGLITAGLILEGMFPEFFNLYLQIYV
ncbi:unnamed protein product [marine sediment metagenome]|uniref:DUF4190 domain-containing protein n=1 Tax=marine sediment metagenome TaxID=412755 RepID=X1LI25_9ZZZZ